MIIHVQHGWQPLDVVSAQLKSLLERTLERHELPHRQERVYPLLNVLETNSDFFVVVELPGVRLEDIQLDVADDSLTLRGYRAPPAESKVETFRRQERWSGKWEREIVFPQRVEPTKARASLASGLLIIEIGKGEARPSRRIPIAGTADLQGTEPCTN